MKSASSAPTEIISPVLLRIRNAFRAPQFQYPALAVVLGTVVLLAYLPGLAGPFVLDDIPNLVQNLALVPTTLTFETIQQAALSGISGPLGRPLAMLSFALNAFFSQGLQSALAFKVTNLAIHLLNAGLVYELCRLLVGRLPAPTRQEESWIPIAVTAAWALHPIQLTSVLYTVQRMTSLSAMFVLIGLIVFTRARIRFAETPSRGLFLMASGLALGLILGCAAKENAILIVLYAGIIELTMFDRATLGKRAKVHLGGFYGVTVLVPILVGIVAIALEPTLVTAEYEGRNFTLAQRLLTESRVLWWYLGQLAIPRLGELGLHHDDISVSTSVILPWQTLPALAGIVAIATLSWIGRRRYPALAFAGLWFLAGHAMESSIVGLELAHEHRNYLPSFGAVFGVVTALRGPAGNPLWRTWTYAGVALWIASIGFITWLRAGIWSNDAQLIVATARHHPDSAKSQAMLGELLAARYHRPDLALERYRAASKLSPTEPGYLIDLVRVAYSNAESTRLPPAGAAFPGKNQNAPQIDPASGGDPARTTMTHAQLDNPNNAESLARLSDRIATQLHSGPITAHTIRSLVATAQCSLQGTGACRAVLPEVVKWHHAVILNVRAKARWRRTAVFSLFDVTFDTADYAGALAAADAGLQHEPDSVDYGLMRADALIALDRNDEARQLLAQVKHDAISADQANSISALQTKIDRRRNQSAPHRRGSAK